MENTKLEIKDYDPDFGVFLVTLTTETKAWSEVSHPEVNVVKSAEDFINLGLEVSTDGRPFTDTLKVGESVADTEWGGMYEGVYIMRVA